MTDDDEMLFQTFKRGPLRDWILEEIVGDKLMRFAQAYLMMARAQYRPAAPSEDEQTESYTAILRALGPERAVIIRTLDVNTGTASDFATSVNIPVDVAMAPDGGLYWLSLGPGSGTNGAIYKISYVTGNRQPTAVASASTLSGLAPLSVSFSGQGSSDPDNDPLTYRWDFGDGQTAAGRDVSHTYNTNGQYSVRLTVNDRPNGSGLSSTSAPLVITVGNVAPVPTITIRPLAARARRSPPPRSPAPGSPRPSSCWPSVAPTPRKLKRSAVQPARTKARAKSDSVSRGRASSHLWSSLVAAAGALGRRGYTLLLLQ
jgi:PKD repeat protein